MYIPWFSWYWWRSILKHGRTPTQYLKYRLKKLTPEQRAAVLKEFQ